MYAVIVGGGKVGEYLASVLLEGGNEVALIETDRLVADRLSVTYEGQFLVINGNGCDSIYQEDAGIRQADIFVAVTGADDVNLVACEIAQRIYNVPRVVSRVNNPKNLRIFREIGVESISSTTLIVNVIEEEALLGSVSIVTSLTHGDVSLIQVTVGRFHRQSEEEGIAIGDIDMPEGSLIVAVAYEDDAEVATPDTLLYPGDQVVVAADSSVVDDVRALFRSF